MRTRKRKQIGGSKMPFLSHKGIYISGEAFKNACKYSLDDRYKIIPFDDKLEENDLVCIKQSDISKFLESPPSKKVRIVLHNTDHTFDDSVMDKLRPYANKVYAVNSSARDAIQIPLGFRDDAYTPHKLLDDVYKSRGKVTRDILCLLNFSIHGGEDSERNTSYNTFKDYKWIKSNVNSTPQLHLDHKNPKAIALRKDFYTKLTRSKFVICPFGAGKDTHRVYEALFYGAIPIIKTSFLDPMYEKLGGCWIVKEWSEVTEEECKKRWKAPPKIRSDVNYWLSSLSFISYGNDKFKISRERINKEATEMGCFNGQIKIYTPDDLSKDFINKVRDVFNESRGGGYWLWKSYIVYDMLQKLNDNDILLYVDSGCSLNKNGIPRLYEYTDMISPSSGYSVLAMRLKTGKTCPTKLTNKIWTSSKIFEYFGISLNSTIATSDQILSGVSMYRKCPESISLVREWLGIAESRPDLFSDKYHEESKKKNKEYRENRHDQSIFTIIVQQPQYNKTVKIIEEEIEKNTKVLAPVTATRHRE